MVRWTTGDGWWRRPSPKGVAQSAGQDATIRPRLKVFLLFSDFGLTLPWPFPCGTRRTSCNRAFRATCACCRSRSRASPRNDLGLRAKAAVEIVLALENPVQAFRHRGLMAVRLLGHARPAGRGRRAPHVLVGLYQLYVPDEGPRDRKRRICCVVFGRKTFASRRVGCSFSVGG